MAIRRRVSQRTEQRQQIISEYIAATGAEVIDMNVVARWAIENELWRPPRYDPAKLCAHELSRAARQTYCVDAQGREVRQRHCYTVVGSNGQHQWLWVDIASAAPEQMHRSLQARRRSALGDVAQLATDLASYNDNNRFGAQLEMSFNFDEDLAEMAQPTDYPGEEEELDEEGEEG